MKWRAIGGNYNGWEFDYNGDWPMGCWSHQFAVRDSAGRVHTYIAQFTDWLVCRKRGFLPAEAML